MTMPIALMWTFMLNPNFGIFNTIENIFGLHGTIPDVLTIKTDRNGFLQNKLRDLPEPVKLP